MIKNQQVMIDRDLAEIYGVETKVLNQAVKRNMERLSKKKKEVKVQLYTDSKTKLTQQDVQKFNAQYPALILNYTNKMHDRFLIIDNSVLYHVGASLKDLGKKCFAFEILDSTLIPSVLANL